MPFIAFLNERSGVSTGKSEVEALDLVLTLLNVLRAIKSLRNDLTIQSERSLRAVSIGEYYLPSLLGSSDRREEWLFLRGLDNKAPFDLKLAPDLDKDVEFRFAGNVVVGLGLAHVYDTLAVSFSEPEWNLPSLKLERQAVFERADDLVLVQEGVDVRHAASSQHVEHHAEWIGRRSTDYALTGEDLWRQREELFPNLHFLARVEAQLRALRPGMLRLHSVIERLFELQNAVAEWDPQREAQPPYKSHVTPEHENRRRLCVFEDGRGQSYVYDLHARFTPGAGRLHFRLLTDPKAAEIAHIGDKL
jgi:hypothetical protein